MPESRLPTLRPKNAPTNTLNFCDLTNTLSFFMHKNTLVLKNDTCNIGKIKDFTNKA